jgi:hypothetical protein
MSNSAKIKLHVKLTDHIKAYQITILDQSLRIVASGSGDLSVNLPPGIYKVQASIHRKNWETMVFLEPGKPPVTVKVPILLINSPIPMAKAAQKHEYHEEAASLESRKVHLKAGYGSAIFVFARRYTANRQELPTTPVHPLVGLTLHDACGTLIADLHSIAVKNLSPQLDPWGACNILVDPGYYRLRLALPTGDLVEQHLYASPGWQLQIFAMQSDFCSLMQETRLNLVDASLFYRRFDPDDPEKQASPGYDFSFDQENYRLTEFARLGLLEKRPVLKSEINEMLWEKFQNPMLGLMGGHLLLMNDNPDLDLLHKVVKNLGRMLGEHPDVRALALLLDQAQPTHTFKCLPMLRRSWNLVLKASIKQPGIVPIDSEASNLSNHLWGEGMWMFSTVKPTETASAISSIIESLTGKPRKQSELTAYESATLMQMAVLSSAASGNPLQVEIPGLRELSKPRRKSSRRPAEEPLVLIDMPDLDEATAQKMVEQLGVPRGNVELFLQRAIDKTNLYESVRTETPAGTLRTQKMTQILHELQMETQGEEADKYKVLGQLINQDSDGSRIAALSLLQIEPDPEYVHFVIDAIGESRSAFEQFEALRTARQLVPALTSRQKSRLKKSIEKQRGTQADQPIVPGSDRWVISEIILRDL